MEWLEFVNKNANAITAIATVVLTITTMVYAWLTSVLAKENRRLRKEGSEPQVVAMLLPDPNELVVLNLIFANIGKGAAYDVRISLEFDEEDFAKHKVILQWVASPPLNVLPQGDKISTFFGISFELLKDPPLQPFTVKCDYRNSEDNRTTADYIIDVRQLSYLGKADTRPETKIIKYLKSIDERLQRVVAAKREC